MTDPTPSTPAPPLDLSRPRRIHVVGVGGTGMSPIATVLVGLGHQVSGSDLAPSAGFERVRALGAVVSIGHDAANVPDDVEVVTISTAVPATNPEVVEARARGIPVYRRAETLAAIAATRQAIAVAGTHGKTTTSSMLALVLLAAGSRPSFIIGGEVVELATGAVLDDGPFFVIEADESDGTFLELPRHGAIVTSVEPDHLEHYGGFEALRDAFARFLIETPGPKVVCADDPLAAELGRAAGAVTYGTTAEADFQMTSLQPGRNGTSFIVEHAGQSLGRIDLPVPGEFNARNATAAFVMARQLGVDAEVARDALGRFGGVARRLEHRGEVGGVTFIDDYAHLPTEVSDVLGAAQDGEWSRIVCVFQPHRYSRTAALWNDFADAFGPADVLAVTDIYPAGEPPRPGVTGKLVAQAVLDAHPWRRLAYLPERADVVAYLVGELRAGDLCLTLGAGDLTTVPDDVQARLAGSGPGSAAPPTVDRS